MTIFWTTASHLARVAEIAATCERLAQNDYNVDGHLTMDGRELVNAARYLRVTLTRTLQATVSQESKGT